MVSPRVRKICSDIRSMRIQGAREIAKAAIEALDVQAAASKARSVKAMQRELDAAARMLAAARPTEPMLRNSLNNALRYLSSRIIRGHVRTPHELRLLVSKERAEYMRSIAEAMRRIAEYGAAEIPARSTVLTHCHSHTVTEVLKLAHAKKRISVICTETRPRYQGLLTAAELAKAGVPVTLIVDSAARHFMDGVRTVLVGADAITSSGELVNKIGTSLIALAAAEENANFFSCAETFKFDPLTLWGRVEPIEERKAGEILRSRMRGVAVRNPAFDVTPARYITAYITEIGVIPPASLTAVLMRNRML